MNKAFLIHYGGYITASLGALIGVSLLSHFVPAKIYGTVALYIALATLFQYVVRESFANALMRHSAEIRQNKYITLTLAKKAIGPLIGCYVLICAFSCLWIGKAVVIQHVFGCILIFLLGGAVAGEAFLSALLKRGAFALHNNIIQWLRFPLGALCFIYISESTASVLCGFIIAFIIGSLFDIFIWKKTTQKCRPPDINPTNLNIFKGYAPILVGFFVWFTTFYDRIAIEKIRGEDMLGIYFVLFQIAYMPVFTLMHASANFLFPLLYNQKKKLLNTKRLLLLLCTVFSAWLFLQLFHQWLFSWLVGEAYRPYSWLLPWLFLAAIINAVAYLYQAKFYQPNAMKKLMIVKAVTAVICLITVTLFAWLYGIEGLVLANVCTSVCLITLSYHLGKKYQLVKDRPPASPI